MKTRNLILIFFLSMLVIALLAALNYSGLVSSPNSQGAHDAYFTRVKYPAVSYEGEIATFTFTVYNQNFTVGSGETPYFYYMFFLDGDLWLSENGTYWNCTRGSSATRSYRLSSWETVQPVVHDLRVALYSFDGNSSQLQDAVQFSVKVALHAELISLMVFSPLIAYLLVISLLGFYMLANGPIEVSSRIRGAASALPQKSTGMVNSSPKMRRRLFFSFYLFVFALGQLFNAFSYLFSFTEPLHQSLYLAIQAAYIILLMLVIRRESSGFREQAYFWPEESSKYVFVSVFLALFYSVITIFLPGILTGYDVFPSSSPLQVLSTIPLALTASIASETIFRGYIQVKLTETSKIPTALLITSVMFALFVSPLYPFDLSNFLLEVLSSFLIGVLLGTLFYRTKTLLCPVIFYSTVLFLKYVTSVEAVTSAYVELSIGAVALAFTLLLLDVLAVKKKGSDVILSDIGLET